MLKTTSAGSMNVLHRDMFDVYSAATVLRPNNRLASAAGITARPGDHDLSGGLNKTHFSSSESSSSSSSRSGGRRGSLTSTTTTTTAAATVSQQPPPPPSSPTMTTQQNGDAARSSVKSNLKKASPGQPNQQQQQLLQRRRDKRVSFADENGGALVSVKIVTDELPFAHLQQERFRGGARTEHGGSEPVQLSAWLPCFPQPAAQYVTFREKLENNLVSLENVMVNAHKNLIQGTIKVLNVGFWKEVAIRVTYDQWAHCQDVPASHQPNSEPHPRFDSFFFSFSPPPMTTMTTTTTTTMATTAVVTSTTSDDDGPEVAAATNNSSSSSNPQQTPVSNCRMECAVRYLCDRGEFWDNNAGKNYVLERSLSAPMGSPSASPLVGATSVTGLGNSATTSASRGGGGVGLLSSSICPSKEFVSAALFFPSSSLSLNSARPRAQFTDYRAWCSNDCSARYY